MIFYTLAFIAGAYYATHENFKIVLWGVFGGFIFGAGIWQVLEMAFLI